MQPDQYIITHREEWDATHLKHDVIVRDFDGNVIKIIPNDNSVMGCYGPMWTPEAREFISKNPFREDDEIYSVDGKNSE
jgi:hypothetical protein